MTAFFERILEKIPEHAANHYNDNYDEFRFGPRPVVPDSPIWKRWLKQRLFKNRVHVVEFERSLKGFARLFPYESGLQYLYDVLQNDESKQLLVDLTLYKMLGERKIKLKTNTPENQAKLKAIGELADRADSIDPGFLNMTLLRYNLKPLGYDLSLYFVAPGVFIDFVLEQYRYRAPGVEIGANPGDVVIDTGGCWGDTALYFGSRVGPSGKVYSFEFIPNNIKIFERNLDLNPELRDRIVLVDQPVWNRSGIPTYYLDYGPSSKVEFEPFTGMTGKTETISIDDFVEQNQISRVDLIKMDIEGAEGAALEGARKTIEKFKPRLAIAIYHSNEQFVDIPRWINELNLGYFLYIDHYTIHGEETVLFAQVP